MGVRSYLREKRAKWNAKQNVGILLKLLSLPPMAEVSMSKDDAALIRVATEKIKGSQYITRSGKIIFTLPSVYDVTIWQVLEARKATTAVDTILAWCGEKFYPETILDTVKASKYITEQLDEANGLESVLFPPTAGTFTNNVKSDDPLAEIQAAKNMLAIIQLTSDLFHCSFEDAKKMNYTDCVLAISKRNEEIEKEKEQLKKQQHKL